MRRFNFKSLIVLTVFQCIAILSFGQNKALGDEPQDTTEAGIFIPNAFTPDGDGNNDLFKPVISYNTVNRYELSIYNRMGELVWYTKDPQASWDGTYQSNPCQSDFYVYKLAVTADNNQKPEYSFGRMAILR